MKRSSRARSARSVAVYGVLMPVALFACSSDQAGPLPSTKNLDAGTDALSPASGGSSSGGAVNATGGTENGSGGVGPAAGGSGSGGMPNVEPPLGAWPPPALKLTEVVNASQPTAIVAAPGDPSRLFFTEIGGRIRLIKNGQLLAEPALDISAKVLNGDPSTADSRAERAPGQGKRGLVALALHPNYAENGRVFVMYAADQGEQGRYGTAANINDDGDQTFEEYKRSASDPDVFDPQPVSTFLQIDKGTCSSCYQHNGGSLEIGPDGFLYASTGDPPPYSATSNEAQRLDSLLGKMLRFDISGAEVKAAGNYPGADPHVWDIGLRNAYKFSFDRVTGTMYVGDVGETSWEEVSMKVWGDNHKNFGWPMREGKHSFQAPGTCVEANCVEPIVDYPSGTDGDNAVIGGMVYRGTAIPDLQGTYVFADNGSRRFRALQVEAGKLKNGPVVLPNLAARVSCFGQDLAGELYVCAFSEGKIFRIDAN